MRWICVAVAGSCSSMHPVRHGRLSNFSRSQRPATTASPPTRSRRRACYRCSRISRAGPRPVGCSPSAVTHGNSAPRQPLRQRQPARAAIAPSPAWLPDRRSGAPRTRRPADVGGTIDAIPRLAAPCKKRRACGCRGSGAMPHSRAGSRRGWDGRRCIRLAALVQGCDLPSRLTTRATVPGPPRSTAITFRPSIGCFGALARGTMAVSKPSLAASSGAPGHAVAGRISPARPTSPNTARPRRSGRSRSRRRSRTGSRGRRPAR